MILLLVDTSGTHGGVVLADIESAPQASNTVLEQAEFGPRQASIQIIPAIARMLETSHRRLADVDVFGAVTGPGSFTGLRVGLSTVKAMAEATQKPIVAVSRLAAMASSATDAELVHAVLEAGRGEFYHGVYRAGGETRVSESLEALPALIEKLQRDRGLVVVSEPSALAALAEFDPLQIADAGAIQALPLAAAAWRARRFTDVAALDANYLGRINLNIATKSAI
jgi:tRNA threonylcarbamoyladenosine biosynthesis protein TsaB